MRGGSARFFRFRIVAATKGDRAEGEEDPSVASCGSAVNPEDSRSAIGPGRSGAPVSAHLPRLAHHHESTKGRKHEKERDGLPPWRRPRPRVAGVPSRFVFSSFRAFVRKEPPRGSGNEIRVGDPGRHPQVRDRPSPVRSAHGGIDPMAAVRRAGSASRASSRATATFASASAETAMRADRNGPDGDSW